MGKLGGSGSWRTCLTGEMGKGVMRVNGLQENLMDA